MDDLSCFSDSQPDSILSTISDNLSVRGKRWRILLSPSVTYYDSGLPKTTLAGTPVWADGAAAYDYESQLPGSTPYERWSTITPNGILSAPSTGISTNYYHQFAVTVSYQVIGDNAPTT